MKSPSQGFLNINFFFDDRGVRANFRAPRLIPRDTSPPPTSKRYQANTMGLVVVGWDTFRGLLIASTLSAGVLLTLLVKASGEGGQGRDQDQGLLIAGKDEHTSTWSQDRVLKANDLAYSYWLPPLAVKSSIFEKFTIVDTDY
ncbi:hypothetical protein H5410_026239 [Solanum commersonii]|uniref:Uncharacterized protein n=1 Tax=Solanum commersonii TaxID=4109 RepID=A0A9J5YVI3_SOLCO|nr:hypothetical protein H5410_026239 [Solanum commersonii]